MLRCLGASVLSLAVVVGASVVTFAEPIAMLSWPGFLILNAVCARFVIFEQTPGNFGPMFAAGLVVDVAIYTLLFFVIIKAWRRLGVKMGTKR